MRINRTILLVHEYIRVGLVYFGQLKRYITDKRVALDRYIQPQTQVPPTKRALTKLAAGSGGTAVCNVVATSANRAPSARATKASNFSLPDLNPGFFLTS